MTWDDESSYAYTNSHDVRDWGWEFIRRDERYKAEWADKLSKYSKNAVLFDQVMQPDLSAYSDFNDSNYSKILANEEPNLLNLIDQNALEPFEILSYEDAAKWGLISYQDPNSKKLSKLNKTLVKKLHLTRSYFNAFDNQISVPELHESLLILIDLSKPLSTQLAEIKMRASELQEKLFEKEPDLKKFKVDEISETKIILWKKYLRCIDAQLAGIKRKEAAKIIFPNATQTPEKDWDEKIKQLKILKSKNYSQFMI